MALSNEWEYMHLTPSGWVQGSMKLDFQRTQDIAVPEDAVLTAYRKVYVGAMGAKPEVTEETTNLSNDSDFIKQLLLKYGKPQFGV
ncbi:hypothetical protein LZT27_07785 [Aeromonas veronii]|uniref:hypothetical protein n=1 Tax=Aeromonas veronii TaxID=654 RepID=UPI0023640639|nr:hypothetical protein [Aeromonas veronii]MDD1844488.1 hypothetical protein [Aeromonas veronii]